MTPDEIDKILADEANRVFPHGAGEAMIQRAENTILKDLRPVRPLAPAWVFSLIFVGKCKITPYTIPAGQSATIVIVFKPTSYAVYNATLSLVYNGGTSTTQLSGAGVVVQ